MAVRCSALSVGRPHFTPSAFYNMFECKQEIDRIHIEKLTFLYTLENVCFVSVSPWQLVNIHSNATVCFLFSQT
jgi:hypothetical protein